MHNEEKVFRSVLKFPHAIGDWTKLEPQKHQEKVVRNSSFSFDRLGDDYLKRIHKIHYELSSAFLASLAKDLKAKIIFRKIKAEQLSYKGFLAKLNKGNIVQLCFKFGDKKYFVYANLTLIEIILNRALGGKIEDFEHKDNLSDMDKEAIKTIFLKNFALIKRAWGYKQEAELSIHYPNIISDPTLNSLDGVVSITTELNLGEDFVNKLIFLYDTKTAQDIVDINFDPSWQENIKLNEKCLNKTLVPVKVELGSSEILMSDIANLEVGDVIQLDKKLGDYVKIIISDKLCINGQFGQNNHKIAVQVLGKKASLDKAKYTSQNIEEPDDQKAYADEAIAETELEKEPELGSAKSLNKKEPAKDIADDKASFDLDEDEVKDIDSEQVNNLEDENEEADEDLFDNFEDEIEPDNQTKKTNNQELSKEADDEDDEDDDLFSSLGLDDDDDFNWDDDDNQKK